MTLNARSMLFLIDPFSRRRVGVKPEGPLCGGQEYKRRAHKVPSCASCDPRLVLQCTYSSRRHIQPAVHEWVQ